MLKRTLVSVLFFAAAATTASGAVSKEQFQLQSGADLVALCGVQSDDPVYAAALHFCHGFGVGMYRTIMQVQKSEFAGDPIICEPAGEPLSRNQYFERFVSWANTHADYEKEPAIDFFTRFLRDEFPCTQ